MIRVYKNPQPEKEGRTQIYHPRVVNFQHVTTQKLAEKFTWQLLLGKQGRTC